MKNIIFFLAIIIFVSIPTFVFSSPNLAERLKGKILLAVEDKGKTFYVHEDGNRYQITAATAQKIFEKLALGITNDNLNDIPLKNVGIEPEVAPTTETLCTPAPVCESNCVACDYTDYKSKVTTLENEIKTLKAQNEELSNSTCTSDDTLDAENALRKEYELKINKLDLENLDISDVERYRYYDLKTMTFDSEFKTQIVNSMFSYVEARSLVSAETNKMNFFNNEQENRNLEIQRLRNELERKILEL